MKIGLIRHYEVNQPFLNGWVKQSQVIKWFEKYDASTELTTVPVQISDAWEKCYSSMLPRAILTAKAIYGGEIEEVNSLNEPSIFPIFSKNLLLPFLVWGLIFRMAILFNHKSQLHRKEVLEDRVRIALERIISSGHQKILIVSHAFVMDIVAKLLVEKGFQGEKFRRAEHARLYTFEKNHR